MNKFEAHENERTINNANLYRNRKCKKCFGRGYHMIQHNNGRPLRGSCIEQATLCSCATKNMTKLGVIKKHAESSGVVSAISRISPEHI